MLNNPQDYSYDYIKQLITSLPESEQLIPCLAYGTGARVSELNQITRINIQPKAEYLEITCPVLKKRIAQVVYRIAVIRMDETWLVSPILNASRLLTNDNDKLIPYGRIHIYRKLIKSLGINPHGFRKLRATHLVVKYGFTGHQLKRFFEWSTVSPSDYYVKLNTNDIKY